MGGAGDRGRFDAYIGDRDRPRSLLVSATSDQAAPLVFLQVEAGDLHGHAEHGRRDRGVTSSWNTWRNPKSCSSVSWASTVMSSMSWASDRDMARTLGRVARRCHGSRKIR